MRIRLDDGWVEDDGTVRRPGADGALRAKELALLRYLAERPLVTIGRAELYDAVWGYHPDTRSRTLDTTVKRVRDAIEGDGAAPRHVLTEAGVGYRFVPATGGDDLAERHVSDALRELPVGGRVVFWGPPGAGRSHWLRAAGGGVDDADGEPPPGRSTALVRPRRPGVVAVEVTPLPPAAAAALVTRRLRELGSPVACPADLSPWDGLPAALLAAADRAELRGRFEAPGPDDPLVARFDALVAGDDALLALASFTGALPADLVADVLGEGRVGAWLDRGLVRRGRFGLAALAHVRATRRPPDPAWVLRLRDAVHAAFEAAHHPVLGPTTTAASERVAALAPHVTDPRFAVRRARQLREPVPAPEPHELGYWMLVAPDPAAVLARLHEVPDPVRGAARCLALRRLGRIPEALDATPDPDDRSLEAGYWHWQLSVTLAFAERAEEALVHLRAAHARCRGHDTFEAAIAGGMGHALVQLGRMSEAREAFVDLTASSRRSERLDGEIGLGFVALARGDVGEVRARARAARDLGAALPAALGIQAAQRVAVLLREIGDVDGARAAAAQALRTATAEAVPGAFVAALHHVLGSALLDAGEGDEALVHLAAAAAEPAAHADARAMSRLLAATALRLDGRDAREALAAANASFPRADSRSARLGATLTPGTPVGALREALEIATRTFDPGLRATALVALGEDGPALDPIARCSFEARLARRLRALSPSA